MTYHVAPQVPGEPDHAAPGGTNWKPIRKVWAGVIAWLGSSAGLLFLDQLTTAIPTNVVWGVVAGGAVTNLAAYLRKSQD